MVSHQRSKDKLSLSGKSGSFVLDPAMRIDWRHLFFGAARDLPILFVRCVPGNHRRQSRTAIPCPRHQTCNSAQAATATPPETTHCHHDGDTSQKVGPSLLCQQARHRPQSRHGKGQFAKTSETRSATGTRETLGPAEFLGGGPDRSPTRAFPLSSPSRRNAASRSTKSAAE